MDSLWKNSLMFLATPNSIVSPQSIESILSCVSRKREMSEMAIDFTVYYWPIAFRGMFVECTILQAGKTFERVKDGAAINTLRNKDLAQSAAEGRFLMAPPFVRDHKMDMWLSQTPAILLHVAEGGSLIPSDLRLKAKIHKLMFDCDDVLQDFTRNNGARMWTTEEFKDFVTTRFTKWLMIFELTRTNSSGDGTYFMKTAEATLADVCVFALFGTMRHCLPDLKPLISTKAPSMSAWLDDTTGKEAMSAHLAKHASTPYCGGLIEKSIRAAIDDLKQNDKSVLCLGTG